MAENLMAISLPHQKKCKILKIKVKSKTTVSKGTLIATYIPQSSEQDEYHDGDVLKFKSEHVGTVEELLVDEGQVVNPGTIIMKLSSCTHPTVMKDMCAECGADLREVEGFPGQRRQSTTASIAMVHSIPELQVSKEEAYQLAKLDEQRLLKNHKLVLLVDLDQTIIHTTMDNVAPDLPGVCHFQLWGSGPRVPWYHTKMRPGYRAFLEKASELYELHIFTMGARLYAHTIASYLDPKKKYFSHRILSRDECFDLNSKTANLRSIFPCGDNMVVIIDDRDDVWNYAPNLILVPPYRYFEGTGDINAPPGMAGKDSKLPAGVAEKQTEKQVEESAKESEVEESDAGPSKELTDSEKPNGKGDGVSSSVEKPEPVVQGDSPKEQSKDGSEPMVVDSEQQTKEVSTENTQENGDQNLKDVTKEKAEIGDGDDSDDYFLYLEDILQRIHKEFYDAYVHLQNKPECEKKPSIPDLKIILPALRQKILAGVNLVFSGVFPTNMNPEQSKAWKVASALGARIIPNVVCRAKGSSGLANATTHVVAAKPGTSKVHTAQRAKNIHIVTPDWLWCCWERWQRVDERLFKLLPGHTQLKTGSKSSSRASTPGTSDSDSVRRLTQDSKNSKNTSRVRPLPDPQEDSPKRRRTSPDLQTKDTDVGSETVPSKIKSRPLSMSAEYNPAYSFSSEELESMDKEVEGIFDESSTSGESEADARSNQDSLGSITQPVSSSSDESLTAESPKGWTSKKGQQDKDTDSNQELDDSSSSAGLSDSEPSSSGEDRMAAEIDDLLTYSKS